jgi:uncharacterized protein with GYD domain
MPYFLFQGSYTPQALGALVQNPEDRSVYIRGVLERLDGRLEGFWLAFGEQDFVLIAQLPNLETAASFSIAAAAGGGVANFKTVPLLTWSEGINAMRQASRAGYRPPQSRGDA